jgi:SOS response regulatory protein OraA/RecX
VRIALVLPAVALFLSLSCCGGGPAYKQEGLKEEQVELALENCRWDATHEQQADGTWVEVEVSDEELKKRVAECMLAKGFEKKKEGEKMDDDDGWWIF